MTIYPAVAALAITMLSTPLAYAQTVPQNTANRVVEQWRKLPTNTHFEKWQYDMWAMSAMECFYHAKGVMPEDLKKFKPHAAGTHGSARNSAAMCEALAQGPNPYCSGVTSRDEPFEWPTGGLPINYAFLKEAGTKDGARATVTASCQLVMNANDTTQFYVGPAVFYWTQKPAVGSLQTFAGERQVNMGSGYFENNAPPGKHPVLVIAR